VTIDPKDLPKILIACRKARVTRLKAGDLEIVFAEESVKQKAESNEITHEPVTLDMLEVAKKDSNVRENLEAIEESLDNLHISDPELYEKLLAEKELEPMSGKTRH
jgi:hypothetical protein